MKKNYIRMWDYRIRNTLGNIHVVDFKTSHVRTFFFTLSDEGLAHSTIKGLYGLLNPSFELAGSIYPDLCCTGCNFRNVECRTAAC